MCRQGNGKYTRRQWLTLYVLGSVHLGSAVCISLQAPFYPVEAESKGASSSIYGLVFGVFELVAFLSSPIFGKYLNTLGVKFTLNIGIVTAAICCILFGLLDLVYYLPAFVGLSFSVRIIESLGAAAALTAAFAITAAVFPDTVGTTFATLEVFYGVGYIIGPTIGGFLYSWGGFKMPFIVTGTFLLMVGVMMYFILPDLDKGGPKHKVKLIEVLKIPSVLLNVFSITTASSTMGYYAAILEPHLRDFSLTPIQIGLIFVISGGTYAVTAPLIGYFCDNGFKPKHVSAIGNFLVILGCCLIGPAPFLPSPTTYGLISGLWSSSFSLGAFVGPSIAGVLLDWVGFRDGTIYILITQTIMLLAVLIFIWYDKYPRHKKKVTNQELYLRNGSCHSQALICNGTEGKIIERIPCQSYGAVHTTPSVIMVDVNA
ncbi:hypothetical protein J437_LFUL001318 [Ladona fulva]|uniref:Major facilitator superfamily (MFS) profile domain-containing protein n=1 Tax=Ladona fulva TaxID=123851 RepID=A0A8K0JZM8_LADFU|nr:hypothetical protein J437_LFUL001318 [Ladona fulva]